MIMNRLKRDRAGRAGMAAAAVFLSGGLLYLGIRGFADEWSYAVQQKILKSAEEMYMPGLAWLDRDPSTDIVTWIREKALAWMPLVSYVEDHIPYESSIEDEETIAKILESQANDENAVDENGNLVGESDESEAAATEVTPTVDMSIEKLRDFDYLLSNFYTVDSSTMIGPDQLNADDLLGRSMKIDNTTGGPKILIFHTHSQEEFADSTPGDPATSIVGVGEYLTQLLNERALRRSMTPECTISSTASLTGAMHMRTPRRPSARSSRRILP